MKDFCPDNLLVLIVDDKNQNLQHTRTILQQAELRTLVTDHQHIIEKIESYKPDLVLLALAVFEVSHTIKTYLSHQDIPILCTLDNDNLDHITRALEIGASDYIKKLVNPTELLTRVKTYLELKQAREQIKIALSEIENLKMIDPLTEVLNQRCFLKIAQKELQRVQRYNYPLSILKIAISTFNHLEYDRVIRDEILKSTAQTILGIVRREDCFARLNGEEFGVLLPFANTSAAISVAQRLCHTISGLSFLIQEHLIKPTICIGIANYQENNDSIDLMMGRANEALLEAKHQGNNNFVVHPLDLENWLANCKS